MRILYTIAALLVAMSAVLAFAVIDSDTYEPVVVTRLAITFAVMGFLLAISGFIQERAGKKREKRR